MAGALLLDPVATAAQPRAAVGFARSPEYRLGVEEELMLVDLGDLGLSPAVEGLVAGGGRWKRELMQCQIEIATEPCRTCGEALEELVGLRRAVIAAAEPHGIGVLGAGTHPFSIPEHQPVTGEARYREMMAAMRYPARRAVLFGMHVHVSVGGGDKAMAVMEALVSDLPLLLALSASSPFWCGEETGLSSTRILIGSQLPRTGLPPPFAGYGEFTEVVEHLVRAGAMPDPTYLWWDVRPHPRFGTLEIRIMDVQPRVEDAAAIAGFVQSLVRHHGKLYDRGHIAPRANRFLVGENRWLAARHGLRAPLVSPQGARPARSLVLERLDMVEDDAAALGATWALERLAELAEQGTSSDRQLREHRSGDDLAAVVRELLRESAP